MTAYADRPSTEPTEVVAGDLVEWRREDLDDYPATSWTLTYAMRAAAGKFDITASAQGSYFSVSVAAATSATWPAGRYAWQAYVTNGSERHAVDAGTLLVKPNLAAMTVYDDRTHARRTLEAIDAVLERRATQDQKMIMIAGRQLERTPLPDLLRFRSHYHAMVQSEIAAERLANGLPGQSRLQVRF